MAENNPLVIEWQNNAKAWINQNAVKKNRLWESANKLEPSELGRIIKYAIENEDNLSSIQIYWLIAILCIKLENKTSLSSIARFTVNLLEDQKWQVKLIDILYDWDPVVEDLIPVKIYPKIDGKGKFVSMTDEISLRLQSEVIPPVQVKTIQSIYYILLLSLDEYPHKKLIFLLVNIFYKSEENYSWQKFVKNEFSDKNKLNDIAVKIMNEVEDDVRFKSLFLSYFYHYVLKMRTSDVYTGIGETNAGIRKNAGVNTPVGEILLITFFIKYYPGCFNSEVKNYDEYFESNEYDSLKWSLSKWMERILTELIARNMSSDVQQKLNDIIDYDG